MSDVPAIENPWRAIRLRAVTSVIAILVPIAILIAIVWGVLPLLGISPDVSVSPRAEPGRAAGFILLALVLVTACFAFGAALASWVALRRFSREEVRSEFLWLMWLPKTSALNGRLFDALFPASGESSQPSNTSLERTRER